MRHEESPESGCTSTFSNLNSHLATFHNWTLEYDTRFVSFPTSELGATWDSPIFLDYFPAMVPVEALELISQHLLLDRVLTCPSVLGSMKVGVASCHATCILIKSGGRPLRLCIVHSPKSLDIETFVSILVLLVDFEYLPIGTNSSRERRISRATILLWAVPQSY